MIYEMDRQPNVRREKNGKRYVTATGIRNAQVCLDNHKQNAHDGELDEGCQACRELSARIHAEASK